MIEKRWENWLLHKRGIDPETAVSEGLRTVDGDLVFPYLEHGVEVNWKARTADKGWYQQGGGTQTWWGHDCLLEQPETVVIVEGEMDRLAVLEAGFSHVLSVPNGAPSNETDPTEDGDPGKRFHFIYRTWPLLQAVKTFIIATDGDAPGTALAGELVKRFRPPRCKFVSWPTECKDANDVLIQYGKSELVRVLNEAQWWPTRGLYSYDELPPAPPIEPVSTCIEGLDAYFKPFLGMFCVITGFPGAGKSQFCAHLIQKLADAHSWHTAVATFESGHPEYFVQVLKQARRTRPGAEMTQDQRDAEALWVSRYFSFIYQDVVNEEDMDLDYLIDRCEAAVLRYSAKAILIDPWNELEHKRAYDETETDYVGRAIRRLKRFAKSYRVAVFVVVHPDKRSGVNKSEPSLYDAASSAHWANKCDCGLILRRDPDTTRLTVNIRKPRFPQATKHGSLDLIYDPVDAVYRKALA